MSRIWIRNYQSCGSGFIEYGSG